MDEREAYSFMYRTLRNEQRVVLPGDVVQIRGVFMFYPGAEFVVPETSRQLRVEDASTNFVAIRDSEGELQGLTSWTLMAELLDCKYVQIFRIS